MKNSKNQEIEATTALNPTELVQADRDKKISFLPPVTDGTRKKIQKAANQYIHTLKGLDPSSPEYMNKVKEISTLAYNETETTTQGATRMLQRASSSIAGAKKQGGESSIKVATSLGDLRSTVESLNPNAPKSVLQRLVSVFPGGDKANKYLQRYTNAEGQLKAIVDSLNEGRQGLEQDNVDLADEKNNQWDNMIRLREYLILTETLQTKLQTEIALLKKEGKLDEATALETEVSFATNQRHQDLLTQLTVAAQGYMAMELIRRNNSELIKGVERAQHTTLTALRTSVIIAQALDQQKAIINQVDAMNDATNQIIVSTGTSLRKQTDQIHAQATSSGISVESLAKAHEDILTTIDNINSFKLKANEEMKHTIKNLNTQLGKLNPGKENQKLLEQKPTTLGLH